MMWTWTCPWTNVHFDSSSLESLEMRGCKKLKCISPRIFELENLDEVFFSDCEQLADVMWPEKAEDNTSTNFSVISFIDCFNLNQETFIQHGNYSELATQEELSFHQKYNHLIIFDCHTPLDLECDQVEIQFHLPNKDLNLNRCGMRLSDDCTPLLANQNEASDKYESIADNDGSYTTALREEECGDNSDRSGDSADQGDEPIDYFFFLS